MDTPKKSEVYAITKKAIIAGELTPGSIINENDLASQFGVSRTPVREALLMLGLEGLVESLPRAGYRITQITIRDVQEAFHLREILEVDAIRLAAARITERDLAILEEKKQGIPPEINPGYNRDFHLTIARASGNMRLARLVEQLLDEMERMIIYDPQIAGPAVPDEHEAIIEGLRHRDPQAAQEAMRHHICAVKERVLQRF